MERTIAYAGPCFTIAYAMCANGDEPGLIFYDNLVDGDKAKMNALFARLGDYGKIENREKFKKVEGELWAFKSHQIRMPCTFMAGRLVLVTHGFRKKTDDIPPAEIQRARRILKEDAERCWT